MQLGTTFDIDYANDLGLNWKDAIKEITSMNLSPVRIGIKWSRVESEKNKYNWKDYDEILRILESKKIPVILTVGMKAPRWPEFYMPDWLKLKIEKNSQIKKENTILKENLFGFMEKVIDRYKKIDSIKLVQIENEPLLRFGPDNLCISKEFLSEEIAFVKNLTDLPILLTDSGLPTTGIVPEIIKGGYTHKNILTRQCGILGLNVFPRFEGRTITEMFRASTFAWKYLKHWYKKAQRLNKECWVTELQAEPWQSGNITRKDAFGNKTCTLDMVKFYLEELKAIGFEKVLIWGTEWHLACKKEGNSEWINRIYG